MSDTEKKGNASAPSASKAVKKKTSRKATSGSAKSTKRPVSNTTVAKAPKFPARSRKASASSGDVQGEKIAFLRKNRKNFKTASEANKVLQANFGTGLIYGVISKELGLKRQTPKPKSEAGGSKRGSAGRPRGSSRKTTAKSGRTRRTSKSELRAPWMVVVFNGHGKTVSVSPYETKDDAVSAANVLLQSGTTGDRLGIFAGQEFSVVSTATIEI